MTALPEYISTARKIQEEVGESRPKFAEIFEKIYDATINHDVEKIPVYDLPSPLKYDNGSTVSTAAEWMNRRRPEILQLFKKEIYGEEPPRPDSMRFEILSQKSGALNGIALRQEVRIFCAMNNGKEFYFDLLLYVPEKATSPVPVFFGLNFKGNHGCTDEQDVRMTPDCSDKQKKASVICQTPEFFDDSERGIQSHRWCFEEVIKRGYACATICYEDIFPDRPDGWEDSCFSLFGDFKKYDGFHEKYSAIGAWAWGISRAADFLESSPYIDSGRMLLHGHSRLGKTSLWAGALDDRFQLVISNDSGCLGAALSHRMFGENFFILVNFRPHWFVKNARKYITKEDTMPFDQHYLLALTAPRPLAVASAVLDINADPAGEFASSVHASEVYALFGSNGLPCQEMPPIDSFVTGDISYHIRNGRHDQTPLDWQHYLEIADHFFKPEDK